MIKPPPVIIKVPATTSNLGPGFDTLGIALNLHNLVEVRRSDSEAIRVISPIPETARAGATAMLSEAASLFFKIARKKAFGLEVSLTGDVPIARGLGSSVTARLGVIAALNEMSLARLNRSKLLDLVAELEHHPDNAAPAVFGGFTAAGILDGSVRCVQRPVAPGVRFVTLIPDFEVSTEQARNLVPGTFSKADTIHNLNRAALITACFMTGNYGGAAGLFEDKVHQPSREKLNPQLTAVIRAGEKAGAVGGWLSGSGSTIICMTLKNSRKVAEAMRHEVPNSVVKILRAENRGFSVV